MPESFTWSSFLAHVCAAVLGYLAGLFTPPPGRSGK